MRKIFFGFTAAFLERNSRFAYCRVTGAFGSVFRAVRNRQKQIGEVLNEWIKNKTVF